MIQDFDMVKSFYDQYALQVARVRQKLGHPLTYAEKILYAHLFDIEALTTYQRGVDYANYRPDRVAMQDATAQMALLQFMNAGKQHVAVPATVHCDHLICADKGADADLAQACRDNSEVYRFLESASRRYGIGFWKPGAGIIHQVVLENYAFPGGMMVGTDSHTPNAGGLGMVAIGVGGADAVDVLTGQPWELKVPRLIGVRLSGHLCGWASPKDVILKLLGILTTKGGTNAILEYFGEGVASISATGRATICNMGAELGATCSLFPTDASTERYLAETGRSEVANMVHANLAELCADAEVYASPSQFYDEVVDINLSEIEPSLNGPFTPDLATPLSKMTAAYAAEQQYPVRVEVALVGSCTNSSYEDLSRAASVARQAVALHLQPKAQLIVCPGSEQIRKTAERDGILDDLRHLGAVVMTNACGPCIGQWHRHTDDGECKNGIVTSFNRNFRRRADGNPNTYAFIASPEITVAMAISGNLCFNPARDVLVNSLGEEVKLMEPSGDIFPTAGFVADEEGLIAPTANGDTIEVVIPEESNRLQRLAPFAPCDSDLLQGMPLLIKVAGKCTTDHISQAGKWLRYRGHLERISDNLLIGAVNAFNGKANEVKNQLNGQYLPVPESAKHYKQQGLASVVVAEENYGEGSSREHAAMEPRFLNVRMIIAKSFARIHETNLKKQGLLALTFADKNDYDKVKEDDQFAVSLASFAPNRQLDVVLTHTDGSSEIIKVNHTYNEVQIKWFRAGSALNYLVGTNKNKH